MLFIAMRASSDKSAHRRLAASKRSIVMIVAGIGLILGTTSVGASLFSHDNNVLLREGATTESLGSTDDQDFDSKKANRLTNPDVLGAPSTTTQNSKPAESAGSAAANAVVDRIQNPTPSPTPAPTPDPPAATPEPQPNPQPEPQAEPEPEPNPNPNPEPTPGQVLGDSTTDPNAPPSP